MNTNKNVCAKCGELNIASAKKCTVCSTVLWAQKSDAAQSWNNETTAFETDTKPSKRMLDYVSPWALIVQLVGALVFLAGVFLWCGNVFGFFPTFSLAGYVTGVAGIFIVGQGFNMM